MAILPAARQQVILFSFLCLMEGEVWLPISGPGLNLWPRSGPILTGSAFGLLYFSGAQLLAVLAWFWIRVQLACSLTTAHYSGIVPGMGKIFLLFNLVNTLNFLILVPYHCDVFGDKGVWNHYTILIGVPVWATHGFVFFFPPGKFARKE